jgi:stearoyl-CoA desaturase (delta-9 desaturase)
MHRETAPMRRRQMQATQLHDDDQGLDVTQILGKTAPPVTVSNGSLGLANRLIAHATIWAPLIGTIAAVVHSIRFGVDTFDIWLGVVMFMLTNLGREFGFHRNLAHRTFETTRGIKLFFAIMASMAGTGRVLF